MIDELAPDYGLDLETTEDHLALIRRHDAKLRRDYKDLKKFDDYVEGNVPLKYMAPEIEDEFGDRISQLVLNIAQLGVESFENRLDIDGIALDPTADASDEEALSWEQLDMQLVTQQVHYESLALGRAYSQVGVDDDGEPVVTAESPFQMTTQIDPLRVTRSAVKRWVADDEKTRMRSLMLPNETLVWAPTSRGKWSLVDRIEHGWGRVPVFTFLNRHRLLRDTGSPQFKVIIPIYEALNKMATDMMVSGEAHANGQRYLGGVDPDAFEDEDGNQVSPLKALIGSVWAIPGNGSGKEGEKLQIGQFSPSDLSNFHNTIKLLMQVGGHLMGLPVAYTAFSSDNPAAEGAIKAGEIQLIKGTERKQTSFGVEHRREWQTVMRVRDGVWSEDAKRLRMIWRNAATPTVAQMADAATKLVATKDSTGRAVLPVPFARQMMGFTAGERDAMAEMDRESLRAGTAAIRDAFAAPEFSDAP